MRRLSAILLACLTLACLAPAGRADAGAWLQEQGKTFLSLGGSAFGNRYVLEQEYRLYAEYGAWPRLTLGLDVNEKPQLVGHALAFARLPLPSPWEQTKLAAEIGAGVHHLEYYLGETPEFHPMYKATLALGRGFEIPWGGGWFAFDLAAERRAGLSDPVFKLDATLGMSSGPRFKPLVRLETYQTRGQPVEWTLRPALMFDWYPGLTFVLGLEAKSVTPEAVGLSLDLWRRF
ncbi:hypothetical protein [Pukyongiella litopenaei]|uniref:Uncharacterized protein n=1 Tax=Pukyongiella litopenaei TaxID=2605946 RepID=A0A2S0MPG6_9RHOB|nr:hypothetical protein [Pukyongiella litopenaei]AVO37603.1 hypothetical protein C6Y53_07740 [Pukyongiella litopenaei]